MKWECRITDNFQFRVFWGIVFSLIFEWAMFCGFVSVDEGVGSTGMRTECIWVGCGIGVV